MAYTSSLRVHALVRFSFCRQEANINALEVPALVAAVSTTQMYFHLFSFTSHFFRRIIVVLKLFECNFCLVWRNKTTVKRRPIWGCRCDERLRIKTEGSTTADGGKHDLPNISRWWIFILFQKLLSMKTGRSTWIFLEVMFLDIDIRLLWTNRKKKPIVIMEESKNVFPRFCISVYYESRKRDLKTKPMYECRCDERLSFTNFLLFIMNQESER